MQMLFSRLEDSDIIEINRRRFEDERGTFTRLYCEEHFTQNAIPTSFPHINWSDNPTEGTLRGMHFQQSPYAEGKLVTCIRGAIFDVGVDIRRSSPHRGRWLGTELSEENKKSLYIPPGFAHGFLTLHPNTTVIYMSTTPYEPSAEGGIRYDDPSINISWPSKATLVSQKDIGLGAFADLYYPEDA